MITRPSERNRNLAYAPAQPGRMPNQGGLWRGPARATACSPATAFPPPSGREGRSSRDRAPRRRRASPRREGVAACR